MVDAVNNNNSNRNTAYTLGGVGVGALAGAGYSHFIKKPLLKDDGPSDEFVRAVYDNQSKQGAADLEKLIKKDFADSVKDLKTVDELKAHLVNNADDLGISEVKADKDGKGGKTIQQVVDDMIGSETDIAKAKTSVENKLVKDALEDLKIPEGKKIQSAIKEAGKLTDETADDALKTFVKNNKEVFGFADDAAAEAHVATLTGSQKDKVKALKDQVEGLFADAKKAITDNWDSDKKSLKALAETAPEEEKNLMKLLKSAAHHVQGWSAAKWAAIGGVVLGAAAYIGSKMTQPKVEEEIPAEALQAHQA